jgi:hypothetical protein
MMGQSVLLPRHRGFLWTTQARILYLQLFQLPPLVKGLLLLSMVRRRCPHLRPSWKQLGTSSKQCGSSLIRLHQHQGEMGAQCCSI